MRRYAGARRLFVYLLLTLTLAAFMWLFLAFSPLGISARLDKYTQDLFNAHLSGWIYPAEHQQDTAVLLLTDEVVDAVLQGQWPAPYSFHATILSDLLEHQPRAVFIDFYWMNQHKPGAEYLVSVLERYQQAGVPVYLSVPREGWLQSMWPELVGLVIPVTPRVSLDATDFIARSYVQSYQGLRSAAFAIAEDEFNIQAAHRGALDIFWGTRANPLNQAWMQEEEGGDGSILGTLLQGFDGVKTPIPYTTTVFVRDLLNPVAETEDEALQELDEHLKGRVIIYGASLSGIQDMVFTPTRAILPGAYYHAMAMDNLLTWGTRYKSATPSRSLPVLGSQTLPVLQFLVLLLIAALVCHWKLNAADRPLGRRIKITVVTLILSACAVQFFLLDLSVAVWAGFLEILGLGVVIERLNLIERWYRPIRRGFCRLYTWIKGEQDAQADLGRVTAERIDRPAGDS